MDIWEVVQWAFFIFFLGGYLVFVLLVLGVMVLSLFPEKPKSSK